MAEKHHKVASPKKKQSLLRKAYIAALTPMLSLLGFSSCATAKKQQKQNDMSQPQQMEQPDPIRRPVLMYGPRPATYKSDLPQKKAIDEAPR